MEKCGATQERRIVGDNDWISYCFGSNATHFSDETEDRTIVFYWGKTECCFKCRTIEAFNTKIEAGSSIRTIEVGSFCFQQKAEPFIHC